MDQIDSPQSPRSMVGSPEPSFERSYAVRWRWDFRHPVQITNEKTGVSFQNAQYLTKQMSVEVLSGKPVQIPYCVSADGKNRFFVERRINHEKRNFLCRKRAVPADAYTATGNETYARRIALVLLESSKGEPRLKLMRTYGGAGCIAAAH